MRTNLDYCPLKGLDIQQARAIPPNQTQWNYPDFEILHLMIFRKSYPVGYPECGRARYSTTGKDEHQQLRGTPDRNRLLTRSL